MSFSLKWLEIFIKYGANVQKTKKTFEENLKYVTFAQLNIDN